MIQNLDELICAWIQIVLLECSALIELDRSFQGELVRVLEDLQRVHLQVAVSHLFAVGTLLFGKLAFFVGREVRDFGSHFD